MSGSETRASGLCTQRVSKPAALGNATGPQLVGTSFPCKEPLGTDRKVCVPILAFKSGN